MPFFLCIGYVSSVETITDGEMASVLVRDVNGDETNFVAYYKYSSGIGLTAEFTYCMCLQKIPCLSDSLCRNSLADWLHWSIVLPFTYHIPCRDADSGIHHSHDRDRCVQGIPMHTGS